MSWTHTQCCTLMHVTDIIFTGYFVYIVFVHVGCDVMYACVNHNFNQNIPFFSVSC